MSGKVHGPGAASVRIYTFKEGMLSRVGHDLNLDVTRFEITVHADKIEAWFDPTSLRTVAARKGKADAPGVLSDADLRQIDENTKGPVLEAARFPKIEFVTTKIDREDDEEWAVTGQLTLHGTTKTVSGEARLVGATRVATFRLNQPEFGIKPFSALMGTLRVQPRVEVVVTVPL